MPYEFYVQPHEYQIAEQNGISYRNVNNRVRSMGWTKQRAITEPVEKVRNLTELKKIAAQNGICASTLNSRLSRGWSEEDATTKPIADRHENIKIQQRKTATLTSEDVRRARENGIQYWTFRRRVKEYGWSIEQAINTKPMTPYDGSMKARDNRRAREGVRA